MGRSRRIGKDWDVTMSLECAFCGLIGAMPAYDVVRFVVGHFAAMHPECECIAEGVQYSSYESPTRCDSCNTPVELPYWQHVSDPPTNIGPIVDADGLWCICDTCHDLIGARDLGALIRRHWESAVRDTPGLSQDAAVQVNVQVLAASKYRELFVNLDSGRRVKVAEPHT